MAAATLSDTALSEAALGYARQALSPATRRAYVTLTSQSFATARRR